MISIFLSFPLVSATHGFSAESRILHFSTLFLKHKQKGHLLRENHIVGGHEFACHSQKEGFISWGG